MKKTNSLSLLFFFLFISISYSQTNCDSLNLLVDIGPDLKIELGDSIEIFPAISAPQNLAVTSTNWSGVKRVTCKSIDCLDATLYVLENSTVTASVIFENGCSASDEMEVEINDYKKVYIPNAFSPNQDGINDVFLIFAGLAVHSVEVFQVFSRKGHLLFEQYDFEPNHAEFGWNGRFDGKLLAAEVYVWKATIQYITDEVEFMTGDVSLIR